ncbi:MAG: ribonuclease [Flavobacteriaceae bacterium]|nr:ribonuclease [Flavobacteriaceae bacterium]
MKIKKLSLFYFPLLGILFFTSLIFSYNSSVQELDLKQFDVKNLSSEQVIISYLKNNHHLPDYYVTRKKAEKSGWIPQKENLCDVLPGKVIGGDVFTNRQNAVPDKKGRKWFEADLNYTCGIRGTDRVVFSNDGLIFVTYDHYNTFEQR